VTHDSNSIGEGFGDYWAFTMSVPVSGGFDEACIADWDSVSYTSDVPHCLRRVDLDLTVDDQTGRIHHDGQIWSRALYDIHNALGRETADTIILQAHIDFGVDPRSRRPRRRRWMRPRRSPATGPRSRCRRRSRTEGSCRAGQATSRLTAWTIAVSPATARSAASHRRPGLLKVGTATTTQPSPTASSIK
jgi:hypothetical protein